MGSFKKNYFNFSFWFWQRTSKL